MSLWMVSSLTSLFFVGYKDELGALRIPSKDDKAEMKVVC